MAVIAKLGFDGARHDQPLVAGLAVKFGRLVAVLGHAALALAKDLGDDVAGLGLDLARRRQKARGAHEVLALVRAGAFV